MQYIFSCYCIIANGSVSHPPLFLTYGKLEAARYIFPRYYSVKLRDSLLAPQDKPTGQSLMFIEHTVPELLTVFEGSTQHIRTTNENAHSVEVVPCDDHAKREYTPVKRKNGQL